MDDQQKEIRKSASFITFYEVIIIFLIFWLANIIFKFFISVSRDGVIRSLSFFTHANNIQAEIMSFIFFLVIFSIISYFVISHGIRLFSEGKTHVFLKTTFYMIVAVWISAAIVSGASVYLFFLNIIGVLIELMGGVFIYNVYLYFFTAFPILIGIIVASMIFITYKLKRRSALLVFIGVIFFLLIALFVFSIIGKDYSKKYVSNEICSIEDDYCWSSKAVAANDTSVCNEDLSNFIRYRCAIRVAFENHNWKFCGELTGKDLIECYSMAAKETADYNYCTKIWDESNYGENKKGPVDNCYLAVLEKTLEENICSNVKNDWRRMECYTYLAEKKNDPSLCMKIEDENMKSGCMGKFNTV